MEQPNPDSHQQTRPDDHRDVVVKSHQEVVPFVSGFPTIKEACTKAGGTRDQTKEKLLIREKGRIPVCMYGIVRRGGVGIELSKTEAEDSIGGGRGRDLLLRYFNYR